MSEAIHILIADDHKVLLKSLSTVLASFPYVKSVSTCSNYNELTDAFKLQVPDVIFLDLNLPPNNGLEICSELRRKYKTLCIIILTSYTEHARIHAAKRNGANAYFIKSVDIEVIDQYLMDWIAGKQGNFVTEGVDSVAEPLPEYKRDPFASTVLLTPREKEIANLIVSGKDHAEITQALGISYDTYKTHRTNILQKLGLKNVAELVSYTYQNKGAKDIL